MGECTDSGWEAGAFAGQASASPLQTRAGRFVCLGSQSRKGTVGYLPMAKPVAQFERFEDPSQTGPLSLTSCWVRLYQTVLFEGGNVFLLRRVDSAPLKLARTGTKVPRVGPRRGTLVLVRPESG